MTFHPGFPTQVADRIQAELAAQNKSRVALASATGLSYKTLQRRLDFPEQMKFAELSAICRALGHADESGNVDITWLFQPADLTDVRVAA